MLTMPILASMTLLTVGITHVKTEMDNFKMAVKQASNENSQSFAAFVRCKLGMYCLDNLGRNDIITHGTDLWSIRISVMIIVILGFGVFFINYFVNNNLHQKILLISLSVMFTSFGVPIIAILRNDNMWKHSKQTMQGLFILM